MKFLLRLVMTALALAVAALVVPGIRYGSPKDLALMALVVGLVNAVITPVVKLLSCPFIILTLGLAIPIINALMLLLATKIALALGIDFHVDGFWPALVGAILISVVSIVLGAVTGAFRREGKR
jgi:putative membrane protein